MLPYICDECNSEVDYFSTKKLLNKRYCENCIGKIKKDRNKKLKETKIRKEKTIKLIEKNRIKYEIEQQYKNKLIEEEKIRAEEEKSRIKEENRKIKLELESRKQDYTKNSISDFLKEFKENELSAIKLENLPIRLKRNENTYFIAGNNKNNSFVISIVLTNNRLFYIDSTYTSRECLDPKNQGELLIASGMKVSQLSNIIAVDAPYPNSDYNNWYVKIHFSNGKCIVLNINVMKISRVFYALLIELIDRLNDPIDESAFSPSRERIPDEVKTSVWRRDNGKCVRCGSRQQLEYDHIIPVSKGGSNTVRNIELLCQTCNRHKSDKI